ncbi:MAG: L,D-transpeptidase Cds6 family protein [Burkholderiaceae bacterium]
MATDTKRPGNRLTIVVIVLLAVSAAVIAMWRVSTTSTVQETPYFPPGHIQIASNQKPASPVEEGSASTSQVAETTPPAQQPESSVQATTPASEPTAAPKPLEPSVATQPPPSAQVVAAATGSTPAASQPQAASRPAPASLPKTELNKNPSLGTEPSLSDVRDSVEQWRQSWESRQAAAYVEFYHPRFPGLTGFARQKNSVMGRAQFIEVKVSDLKLSLEPGFTKAEFKQHYKSNTYESFDVKTQHWVMTNSGPRIIEETIRSLSR